MHLPHSQAPVPVDLPPAPPQPQPELLPDLTRLPDTPNQRLVGRETELEWLDAAWESDTTHIISLIAEGGVGKSALVNDWLGRMQLDGYRGADAVIGWSFYSQGSKERLTSAEPFLDWAVEKLGLAPRSNTAPAKAQAIVGAMAARRVLLALDGMEPLQEPPGTDLFGKLKDTGLRELLRGVAQLPGGGVRSLIVITSRAEPADLQRWRNGAAPWHVLETLSPEAGAELLKAVLMDGAALGAPRPPQADLIEAAKAQGGHALSLSLLGGYIRDIHHRDIRKWRDLRAPPLPPGADGSDHAVRVLQSYVDEWLDGRRWWLRLLWHRRMPRLLAVMSLVGLFDRPADAGCLAALRRKPAIKGLTDDIVRLSPEEWQSTVARLRRARLLLQENPTNPGSLDAHPIVREYFGERLREKNPEAWTAAHGRIYEHLTATEEGDDPDLAALAPLFQAIPHGVRAGRVQAALDDVYANRLCRRGADGDLAFHAFHKLGAVGQMLSAVAWFFDPPYGRPSPALSEADRSWVLSEAAYGLRALGRLEEAIAPMSASLDLFVDQKDWSNAAILAGNLSQTRLAVGRVAEAVASARRAVVHADRSDDASMMMASRTALADALHQSGDRAEAAGLFRDAEARQAERQPGVPRLYSLPGFRYCDLLLAEGAAAEAMDRADYAMEIARRNGWLLHVGLDTVTLARAALHQALSREPGQAARARAAAALAVDRLRAAGDIMYAPRGLLARAAVARYGGEWEAAGRDLDEVQEIAEPGPMRLFMADAALERARLCVAQIEAHAPLDPHFADIPKPVAPGPEQAAALRAEAEGRIAKARALIDECGYGRRIPELEELQAILAGTRPYASLPPRV